MEVVKGNLDGSAPMPEINENAVYLVDFSKMENIQDLIMVLSAIGFSFSAKHPHFNLIKHLLALDNPIELGKPVVPKETEIKLPKLKRVDK